MACARSEFVVSQARYRQKQSWLSGRKGLVCKPLSEDAALGEATLPLRCASTGAPNC